MSAIRVARLWSDVVDDVPVLDPALGRATAAAPVDAILAFLNGGAAVLRGAGRTEDWLDPARPAAVPLGFRTDGTWLWSDEVAYYLRVHGVMPEADFFLHMERQRFVATEPDDDAVRAAEAMLLGGEPAV